MRTQLLLADLYPGLGMRVGQRLGWLSVSGVLNEEERMEAQRARQRVRPTAISHTAGRVQTAQFHGWLNSDWGCRPLLLPFDCVDITRLNSIFHK